VFLHPGVGDSGVWEPQWQALAPRFSLVRCDLPGFGRSPVEQASVSLAGAVAALLDALHVRGSAIVGNSLGARVALELAVARPELVGALVLVGALLPGGEASSTLSAFNEAERRALEEGDLERAVELNLDMWLAPGTDESVREHVRRMQRRAFELQLPWGDELTEEHLVAEVQTRLEDVRVPTLVVVGSADVDDVQQCGRRLLASLPESESATVVGAAHVPSLERPEDFDAAVRPFLERVLSA